VNSNKHSNCISRSNTPNNLLQSQKYTDEVNFAAMAGRLKQTVPLIDSDSKIYTNEEMVTDKKLEGFLSNADSSNPHLFFMQVWDPFDQKSIVNQNRPLLSKWEDLILDNEHQEIAKPDQLNNDTSSMSPVHKTPTKGHSVTKLSKINAKKAIQSMMNISRKINIFKETLFNSKVQVRLSYRTFFTMLLTLPIFLLVALMILNSLLMADLRTQRLDVLNTEIVIWENAWKILMVATNVQQDRGPVSAIVPQQLAAESFFAVN
jgi:hypothetical protein